MVKEKEYQFACSAHDFGDQEQSSCHDNMAAN